jgi:glycosyltransferase involved in cell wall biosynthesis
MANLRDRRTRWLQVLPLLVAFQVAAMRAVRRQRPDVIHAHWILPAGIVARLLRLLTGTPYVVTAHGADAYTLRSGPALWLKRTVLRNAEATIPVSSAIGADLATLGPVTKAVPMGVDVRRIRAEVGERRPEPGRVLLIGRLVEKKGANVLLDAAVQVPEARVVIAGDGPLFGELTRQAQHLGIADRVEFLGQCPRAEVMNQLARAAVVALPSQIGAGGDQDGVPVVLGEAMAAGVPLVASDLGGLGEHVVDGVTGLLVAPGSPIELADALRRLIDKPDYAATLAATARERMGVLDLDYLTRSCRGVLLAAART